MLVGPSEGRDWNTSPQGSQHRRWGSLQVPIEVTQKANRPERGGPEAHRQQRLSAGEDRRGPQGQGQSWAQVSCLHTGGPKTLHECKSIQVPCDLASQRGQWVCSSQAGTDLSPTLAARAVPEDWLSGGAHLLGLSAAGSLGGLSDRTLKAYGLGPRQAGPKTEADLSLVGARTQGHHGGRKPLTLGWGLQAAGRDKRLGSTLGPWPTSWTTTPAQGPC